MLLLHLIIPLTFIRFSYTILCIVYLHGRIYLNEYGSIDRNNSLWDAIVCMSSIGRVELTSGIDAMGQMQEVYGNWC